MPLSLPEIVLFGGMFGIIVHSIVLGRLVARREKATSESAASLFIFFSGMWFIGPFAYFGFKRTRPLLAKACLRQLLVVTAFWILIILLSSWSVDFVGKG